MKFEIEICLKNKPERKTTQFWTTKNKSSMIEFFKNNPKLKLLKIIKRVN